MKTKPISTRSGLAWLVGLLSVGGVLLVGCDRRTQKAVPDPVLAEVNGKPITATTFRDWWQQHSPGADTPQTRQATLDRLIERSALVQQARAAGLDSDPIIVEQMENLLIRRLEETRLQPKVAAVEVSSEEVQAYYQQNLATKFTRPEQRRLAVLWFKTRGQAPLAARYRPRLEQARADVLRDPTAYPVEQGFGALSIRNSEHQPSRYKGGDLGWLETSDVPGFRADVMRIGRQLSEPGEVSPVVETNDGLFVVRLMDVRPAGTIELASVESAIRHKLRHLKRQQVETRFHEEIQRSVTVTPYPEHLAALTGLEPSPTLTAAREPTATTFDPPEAPASQRNN